MTALGANAASGLVTVAYDAQGRRSSLDRSSGADTVYGYDASLRLASLAHDLAGTASDLTLTLAYSPANQATSRPRQLPNPPRL
jgi:hypothetical protein